MKTITVITKHPEAVPDYLGFGCKIIEEGENSFGDHVLMLVAHDRHARWQADRLGSGLHGARIMADDDEMYEWIKEWGYTAHSPVLV